jgi:Na+/proline symporter
MQCWNSFCCGIYFRLLPLIPRRNPNRFIALVSFSAWTFTGAAGKIYSQGFYVLLLYYSSLVPLLFFFHLLRDATAPAMFKQRFGKCPVVLS